MKQVARNLTDVSDGILLNKAFLIINHDTKYTQEFRDDLDREGVKPVRCPARAANCNAFAERFVRSIKDECLDRMILFGEASLRRALREYVMHFRRERNHQGVGNRLLERCATGNSTDWADSVPRTARGHAQFLLQGSSLKARILFLHHTPYAVRIFTEHSRCLVGTWADTVSTRHDREVERIE